MFGKRVYPEAAEGVQTEHSDSCCIRILSINDVYELDNFPHFASARQIESEGPALTIGALAGDFLAPSLLSSLDKGRGKVDCMNLSGIDFVCIGNHEDDVPLSQMHSRIGESKFTWINSNMQTLPLPPGMPPMPEYVIVEATAGAHTRRIALLGLNTNDPALYKPRHFGGCVIEDVNKTAASMYERIMSMERVDAIVPLTHQLVGLDRELAELGVGFPVIIGGHDHEVYIEEINGCHVVKAGTEGENILVVDLVWSSSLQTSPIVTVKLNPAKNYPPDPLVSAAVLKHQMLTKELDHTILCKIPDSIRLSSQGIRLKQTTMGTFLTTAARNILSVDCAMLCGGNIRGDRVYEGKHLTYSNLKQEFPFDTKMVRIQLPGHVIANTVQYTRAFSLQSPPVAKGCYMQVDDGITWDRASNTVLTIAGSPVDPARMYSAAINLNVLQRVDDIFPIIEYCESRGMVLDGYSDDSAMELKNVLVGFFSKLMLYDMLVSFDFETLDANSDGVLDMSELQAAAQVKDHSTETTMLLIQNLLNVGDAHHHHLNGITKADILAIGMTMHEEIQFAETHKDDLYTFEEFSSVARGILGSKSYEEALVRELFARMDENGDGFVSHGELTRLLILKEEVDALVI